jgi:hypothetical protein
MSVSGLDRAVRFTTSGVYQIPNPIKNPHNFADGSLSHLLGGWAMTTVVVAQTGPPLGFDISPENTGTSAIKLQGILTASVKPGYSITQAEGAGAAKNRLNHYFSDPGLYTVVTPAQATPQIPAGTYPCGTSATHSIFACPTGVQFGNLPTNTLVRAPGQKTVDFSLTKTTKIFENYSLEIRADAFNLFNWVNFAGPDAGPSDPTFGVINGTTVDPRVVQVAAKFKF